MKYAVLHVGTVGVGGVDFIVETQTATFTAGRTEACVQFTVVDDALALEGNETFTVDFVAPPATERGSPSPATVTITDDDGMFIVI